MLFPCAYITNPRMFTDIRFKDLSLQFYEVFSLGDFLQLQIFYIAVPTSYIRDMTLLSNNNNIHWRTQGILQAFSPTYIWKVPSYSINPKRIIPVSTIFIFLSSSLVKLTYISCSEFLVPTTCGKSNKGWIS